MDKNTLDTKFTRQPTKSERELIYTLNDAGVFESVEFFFTDFFILKENAIQ